MASGRDGWTLPSSRLPPSWGCLRAAVPLVALGWMVTGSFSVVLADVVLIAVVFARARRVGFDVHETGVVVRGFVTTKRLRWNSISRFERMRLSSGRPGSTGAVVIGGRRVEILALRGPDLDDQLWALNAMRELAAVPVRVKSSGATKKAPRESCSV